MDNLTLIAETGKLTKQEAYYMAEKIINQVNEGWVNPLEALAKLTYLQTAVDAAIKVIRDKATEVAQRDYPTATFNDFGVEFQVKETSVKYDYTGDQEWVDLNDQAKGIALELKQCEERIRFRDGKNLPRTSKTSVSVILGK